MILYVNGGRFDICGRREGDAVLRAVKGADIFFDLLDRNGVFLIGIELYGTVYGLAVELDLAFLVTGNGKGTVIIGFEGELQHLGI